MDPGPFLFCALVITIAFAVRSTAGFGSATLAVPLTALVLPLQTVIPVVASLQLVSMADHGARSWGIVSWREMRRIAPFIVTGVIAGVYLFARLEDAIIGKALGVFVIAYALWALATAKRTAEPPRHVPWPVSAVLNTGGAVIGALFGGASSPFYAIYLRALRLSRDAFRATMNMIMLVQVVLRLVGYSGLGIVDAYALALTLLVLPFMLLGARLGDLVAERVVQETFNRILGAVLLMSGAALIVK